MQQHYFHTPKTPTKKPDPKMKYPENNTIKEAPDSIENNSNLRNTEYKAATEVNSNNIKPVILNFDSTSNTGIDELTLTRKKSQEIINKFNKTHSNLRETEYKATTEVNSNNIKPVILNFDTLNTGIINFYKTHSVESLELEENDLNLSPFSEVRRKTNVFIEKSRKLFTEEVSENKEEVLESTQKTDVKSTLFTDPELLNQMRADVEKIKTNRLAKTNIDEQESRSISTIKELFNQINQKSELFNKLNLSNRTNNLIETQELGIVRNNNRTNSLINDNLKTEEGVSSKSKSKLKLTINSQNTSQSKTKKPSVSKITDKNIVLGGRNKVVLGGPKKDDRQRGFGTRIRSRVENNNFMPN
jgi:hypothetical protein